jgi:hypothetical protein
LVVPGAQPLVEGQGLREAEEVKLNSPEAAEARELSQTAYEGFGSAEAATLASEAFPQLVTQPEGGLPPLPVGDIVVGFVGDDAARVDMGDGSQAVLESLQPMAAKTASGVWAPIDLRLRKGAESFSVANPAAEIDIPTQVANGVSLTDSGVSLTPVDGLGQASSGSEGVLDGATVLYADTAVDTDTLVKPTALGFQEDALLRSARSPKQLDFQVSLPTDGALVEAGDGSGAAEVIENGAVVARILEPHAVDAAGMAVPVSMEVFGDRLQLTVDASDGSYEYPIEVDPTVTDSLMNLHTSSTPGNWFAHSEGGVHALETSLPLEAATIYGEVHSAGSAAYFKYATQGSSEIYEFIVATAGGKTGGVAAGMEPRVRIANKFGDPTYETEVALPENYGTTWDTLCIFSACGDPDNTKAYGDAALYEVIARQTNPEGWAGVMSNEAVLIEQTAGPKAIWDTSDPEIETYGANALYGSKWVKGGSLEAALTDPGVGVMEFGFSSPNAAGWHGGWPLEKHTASGCEGAQCDECLGTTAQCSSYPSNSRGSIISPAITGLPEGEDTIEGTVKNATGTSNTASVKLKLDKAAPHEITLSGLPGGSGTYETGEGTAQLKVTAKDGSGTTPSSGMQSIEVTVDGRKIGTLQGSCSVGPCTGSGVWTLSGAEFGAGEHKLSITAIDKAGNQVTEASIWKVRAATPVPVGPGSVNPVSGALGLAATDVSMSTPSGALTVSRSYDSVSPTGGSEGVFGAQWGLSIGSQESLTATPVAFTEGKLVYNAQVVTASGTALTFTGNSKNEFTAPKGDANLTLNATFEHEQPVAFIFKEPASGRTTKFAIPSGGSESVFMASETQGPLASEDVSYSYRTVEVEGKKLIEPTQVLAAAPAGVSCTTKLENGCRALTFNYAESTTATGENQSQWGDY